MLVERQLGVTTANGLQVHLSLAVVPVTQAGRWKGINWVLRLQMAFKSSHRFQPCWLPKLDAEGASIGVHDYKWPSSPPTTYSHADYPSWMSEGHQLGITTTNGLQVHLPLAVAPIT